MVQIGNGEHEDIALNGCECMVMIKHLTWCLMGGLGTVGRCPTESHDCITQKKNLCRVVASKDRYPLG